MSGLKIKDLISINEEAVIDKEVELDWHENKELNLMLCRKFRLSSQENPCGNRTSSVSLLELFNDFILKGSTNNKYIIISGYGKGKSHFALFLANYFSGKIDSPEIKEIFEAFDRDIPDKIAGKLKKFKSTVKFPQLIIPLNGNKILNLRSDFLNILKKTLLENIETKNYKFKCFFTPIKDWLGKNIDKDSRKKADSFLIEKYSFNLKELEEKLDNCEERADIISLELCEYLSGKYPDFYKSVNLQEVITAVYNDLCVEGPYYKIIIFFDELDLYIDRYRKAFLKVDNIALQEIINACNSLEDKICFISFVQEELARHFKKDKKDEFDKFITFLKRENRFFLMSKIEAVIPSMISKLDTWSAFMLRVFQFKTISQQSYQCLPYYRKEGWTEKRFLEDITMSCYPVHPITAGILARLDLGRGKNFVNFIKEKIRTKFNEPATVNLECKIYGGQIPDIPNWIYPYEIVDYFEENIKRAKIVKYKGLLYALEQMDKNIPEECFRLLKSVFLYSITGLEKGSDYYNTISLLSGLEYSTAKYYLERLEDKYKVIYFNEKEGEYDFYSPGAGLLEVNKKLEEDFSSAILPDVHKIIDYLLKYENDRLRFYTENLGLVPEEFLSRKNCVRAEFSLKSIFCGPSDFDYVKDEYEKLDKNINRGIIFYFITEEDKELNKAKEKARELIGTFKSSYKSFPLPVLFAFPLNPLKSFSPLVSRLIILNSWPREVRKSYGKGFERAVNILKEELRLKLQDYFNNLEYITHQAIIKSLPEDKRNNQKDIINKLFELSFIYRPSLSYSSLKTNSQGKKIAGLCSSFLCKNGRFDKDLDLEAIPKKTGTQLLNIIKNVFPAENDGWGLLDEKWYVRRPLGVRISRGWDLLNEFLEKDNNLYLYEIYKILEDPPFGYDDITFSLLLSAWLGFQRDKIDIYEGDILLDFYDFSDTFQDLDVIAAIQKKNLCVRKIDMEPFMRLCLDIQSELRKEIKEYKEIKLLLEKVEKIISSRRFSEEDKEQIRNLSLSKKEIVSQVEDFFSSVEYLFKEFKGKKSLIDFCRLRVKIINLKLPENVNYSRDRYIELLKECDKKIIDLLSIEPFVLEKEGDYIIFKERYEKIRDSLKEASLSKEAEKIENKILKLNEVQEFFLYVDTLNREFNKAKSLFELCEIMKKIKDITFPENITYPKNNYQTLLRKCNKKIKEDFEKESFDLKRPEDYKKLRDYSEKLKKSLSDAYFADLSKEVEEHIFILDDIYERNEIYKTQKKFLDKITDLPSPYQLTLGEVLKNLDIISLAVEKIDIEEFTSFVQKKRDVYVKQLDFFRKKFSELEDQIFKVKDITECETLRNKIKENKEIYENTEYENRFKALQELLNKKEKSFESQEENNVKRKSILQEISYVTSLSKELKDPLSLYDVYSQIHKIEIPPDLFSEEDLKEIKKARRSIYKRISKHLTKEISKTKVSKKYDYQKKKSRFDEIEERFIPVGDIDDEFIKSIKDARVKLNKEYSEWKSLEEQGVKKREVKKLLKEIENYPCDRISFCNTSLEILKTVEEELKSYPDLPGYFKEDIKKQERRLKEIKEKFMGNLDTYTRLTEQIDEPDQLVTIEDELARIYYIFDEPESEKEFNKVRKELDEKLKSKKVHYKRLSKMFYRLGEKDDRLECFIEFFNEFSSKDKKNILEMLNKMHRDK